MADTIKVIRFRQEALTIGRDGQAYYYDADLGPVLIGNVIDLTLDSKIVKVSDANKDHPLLGEHRVVTEYNVWWEAINAAR